MRRRKNKFSLGKFIIEKWHDLRVKIIILSTLFISVLLVIIIVAVENQKDKSQVLSNANKYETYVDSLLLKKYSKEELKDMGSEELKLIIDDILKEESDKKAKYPTLKDFIFPAKEDDYSTFFKEIRGQKESWSNQDVDNFWQSMEDINIDELEKKNFEYLKAKLKEVN